MAGGRAGRRESHRSRARPAVPTCATPPRPGSGSREGRDFRRFPLRREKSRSSETGGSGRAHGAGGRFPGGGRSPGRVGADGAPRGIGIALWGQPGREAPGGPALHQGGAAGAHRGAPHPVREGGAAGKALRRPDQASGRGVELRPPLQLHRDGPHQEEAALQDPPQAHHHQRGQESVRELRPPPGACQPRAPWQAVEGARPPDLPRGARTVPPERAGPALCGNPMNCFCSRVMNWGGGRRGTLTRGTLVSEARLCGTKTRGVWADPGACA